jgi:hypothetical protein
MGKVGAAVMCFVGCVMLVSLLRGHEDQPPSGRRDQLCSGGAQSDVGLQITLDRIDTSRTGQESLEFSVRSFSRFRGKAIVRHVVEIRNDQGLLMAERVTSPTSAPLKAGEGVQSKISTPQSLPDGYYRVVATAVGSDGAGEADETAESYFHRARGVMTPISINEYLTQSRANLAYRVNGGAPAEPVALLTTPCEECCVRNCPVSIEGVVRGQLLFFNAQGNFCASGSDCTGAKYPQSEFGVPLPIRDARVFVRVAGSVIGQGVTDANGNFTMAWQTESKPTTSIRAELFWQPTHKDGRFSIITDQGYPWELSAGTVTLLTSSSVSSPQSLGAFQWGTTLQDANPIANVYDGAWRTWEAFRVSNRMLTYFNNIRIQAFDTRGECPTSCAIGPEKLVILDPGSPFSPQSRIMHELGHIASYLSSRDQSFRSGRNYCYPDPSNDNPNCTNRGWRYTSTEWGAATFEEGLANFLGDVALYSPNARAPLTCLASKADCGGGLSIESSSRGSCASDENRFALSVERYLWDVFDSNIDYPGESLTKNYFEFFDAINSFDNGHDNLQKEEPWVPGTRTCDVNGQCQLTYDLVDLDGRSANDLRQNWARLGTNTDNAFFNNCTPVGD